MYFYVRFANLAHSHWGEVPHRGVTEVLSYCRTWWWRFWCRKRQAVAMHERKGARRLYKMEKRNEIRLKLQGYDRAEAGRKKSARWEENERGGSVKKEKEWAWDEGKAHQDGGAHWERDEPTGSNLDRGRCKKDAGESRKMRLARGGSKMEEKSEKEGWKKTGYASTEDERYMSNKQDDKAKQVRQTREETIRNTEGGINKMDSKARKDETIGRIWRRNGRGTTNKMEK